jgi:hypothetical protein
MILRNGNQDGLDKSFHSFYVCTAVRKFFFFLDPLHTGKIRILVSVLYILFVTDDEAKEAGVFSLASHSSLF